MQFLTFHIGADHYGLATRHVRSVLPLMALKALPLAPAYVAGLMNFRGAAVPVIDLAMLAGGAPASRSFDTRIVLLDYVPADGVHRALGLVAERVAAVEEFADDSFADSGVANQAAGWLGQVSSSSGLLLQLVEPAYLLTPEACALLFGAAESGVAAPC